MISRLLADAALLLHFGFIVFAVVGGLLVLRWPRLAWVHLPCVAWGVLVELCRWRCPLTTVENVLRRAGGEAGYGGGFVEHYLMPIIYPPGLAPEVQWALALGLVLLNGAVYARIWASRRG